MNEISSEQSLTEKTPKGQSVLVIAPQRRSSLAKQAGTVAPRQGNSKRHFNRPGRRLSHRRHRQDSEERDERGQAES